MTDIDSAFYDKVISTKVELRKPTLRIELDIRLEAKDVVYPNLTIDGEPVDRCVELSICGTSWLPVRGRWRDDSGGQLTELVRSEFGDRPGVATICDLWDRWHLNLLRPGLRVQEEYLREYRPKPDDCRVYDAACRSLQLAGLHPDDPKNTLNIYAYGAAWLAEPLPEDVVNLIGATVAQIREG